MRIGLFTDTYRPSINGIVFVVESLKTHLESMGHEVYIFCPARSIRRHKHAVEFEEDDHIIRFPSVKGAFYDDYDTSLFFPPRVLQRIKSLDLDIIHVLTPGQVGLMGIQAAWRQHTPFVVQHCTDLYEFVEHYPAVLPGALALLSLVVPFTVRLNGKDVREIAKLYRPRREAKAWNQDIIAKAITIVYSKADAVIALSRKSQQQLKSWQTEDAYRYDLTLLPNGVDPLPKATKSEAAAFRTTHGIDKSDEVYGFVGRLGEEKNLPILIEALPKILKKRPHARLLFVGDFEFREQLEEMAQTSGHSDRITFTGALPRETLGVVYAAMDVFVFPSLKDTQGWVLHESAHAGLPIVLIDTKVSEVVRDGENGYFARNNPTNLADKIVKILDSPDDRKRFAARSRELARIYTEKKQIQKLAELYGEVLRARSSRL